MARGTQPCGAAASLPLWSKPSTSPRAPAARPAQGKDQRRAACRLRRVTDTQEEAQGPDPLSLIHI
eukprot:743226-Alexandrium_andersonii.AAC.1